MDRRKFLAVTGTTATSIGLAGCSGTDDGTAGDETDIDDPDPDEVTTTGEEMTTTGEGDGTEGESVMNGVNGETDEVSQYVEVTSHEAFDDGDNVGVRGIIENTSDKELNYVEVEVTLNDGDTVLGEFIDTSDQELDSLPSGEVWEFEVTFEEEVVTSNTSYTINVQAELADGATDGTGTETGTETETTT